MSLCNVITAIEIDGMRLLSHVRKSDDEERLIPLINIIFLMLIFFMLAGSIESSDYFTVAPPFSSHELMAEQAAQTLLVAADGRMALDGREISLPVLPQLLQEQQRTADAMRLVVKADSKLAAGRLLDIMDALKAAGLKRLVLLTVAADV